MKFTPDKWAAAAVKNLGPHKAAAIAQTEGREFIGNDIKVVNPNRGFFIDALNWIKGRHPDCLKQPEQKEITL